MILAADCVDEGDGWAPGRRPVIALCRSFVAALRAQDAALDQTTKRIERSKAAA